MTKVGRLRLCFSWLCLGFAIAAALTLLIAPAAAEERVVNFYNWSNYMAPEVLEAFTKETGIKVVYDTFDANETLETRLMAGKSGYDVVVPTAYFLQRQIKANIFQKLDKSKLPNLVNAWPVVTQRLGIYDPGNVYAANYMVLASPDGCKLVLQVEVAEFVEDEQILALAIMRPSDQRDVAFAGCDPRQRDAHCVRSRYLFAHEGARGAADTVHDGDVAGEQVGKLRQEQGRPQFGGQLLVEQHVAVVAAFRSGEDGGDRKSVV